MNKRNVIHPDNGILLIALKGNEILAHPTTWMNLEDIMLNEPDTKG